MKTLFLTGGSGNIGSAIKTKFEQNGYYVIAPTHEQLDLSDSDSIEQFFKFHGTNADVIIHCAGYNNPTDFEDITKEEMQKSININYLSFLEIVKIVSPFMQSKNSGHILAISSLYGSITRKKRLAYTASKHALNGMVQTLACELAPYNILVNSLAPGFVDTKMTRKNNTPEQIKALESKIPLGRMADVSDIAKTAFYLCSEENTYITGQNIIVDGGFMAEGGQGNV